MEIKTAENPFDVEETLVKALELKLINQIPKDEATKVKLYRLLQEHAAMELNGSKSKEDKLYEDAINSTIEENLPVPHEIEGEIPKLPIDFTELSDKQVRYYMGVFNACAARAGWLYAFEEAGEQAAKAIVSSLEDEYIITKADRKDYGGKAKPQALLKSEARMDNSSIQKWSDRENEHSIKSNKYKRLLDHYNLTCDRLSREFTMRVKERENK